MGAAGALIDLSRGPARLLGELETGAYPAAAPPVDGPGAAPLRSGSGLTVRPSRTLK
jgi:hypothetical protein